MSPLTKPISHSEMVCLMLFVNLDSLKRNVSIENWFGIHEKEKNNFTKLIWIKEWHREVQMSVSYVFKAMYLFLNVCFIS
jgi:hypothetical protein